MIDNTYSVNGVDRDLKENLNQIRRFMETHILKLEMNVEKKDAEITQLREELQRARQMAEGNAQLVNKLLGDLSKLHTDVDWYKRTYEKRSLLGTLREKLFRKHR